ncbi:MAG TPA: PAS domain-containing sensor histidine kinase [Caulobacteraceae bacterium]|nr:PAS domain-containing sensor histidine kinase [Caulobacteraceae bacterium]
MGWRGLAWRERLNSSFALGSGYGLAALLTAVTVWMASSAPITGPVGPRSQAILVLQGLNLILIVALAAAIGWRVLRLIIAQRRDAGARLHLRFVLLFAGVAAVPAIAVALVFGVLVTQGVDSWFDQRVRTVVDNSVIVAKSWLGFQKNSIHDEVQVMASDLNRAAPGLQKSPVYFSRFLAEEAAIRNFPAAYLIDHDGRILARAEVDAPPRYLSPPPGTLADADNGVMTIRAFDSADLMTGVARLKAFDDAYLYVVRSVDHGILGHLSETAAASAAYKDIAAHRAQIKAAFEVSYLETVLLVLVGAVWIALAAANSISGPIARLVQAADRIAGGDLTARVSVDKGPEEIADLARSFNRMTGDLQAQRAALVAAGSEAESRSQFIEAVLSGVSAGVIGLDRDGRISAENRQALVLLGLARASAHGHLLSEAAPELAEVATEAAATGRDAEIEVDVVRTGEARRLRVRASGRSDGGLVLTFDDITRLVTAQRNAAWKDVARRIAHEIKNPLTPIQLSAERLRRKYRKEIVSDIETFDRCTDTIIRQVGDIGRMVDEFSAFARMPAPAFSEADPAEVLHHAVFAQRVADPETEITLSDTLPQLRMVCDTRMIGQALANVLKNAGEAIAARRTSEPELKGHIEARLSLVGDQVVFEVEDNGIGLPAKGRERLTEPYVTTREKGTGLGLAIVKRIVEEHGGELALLDAAALPGARAILRIPKLKSAHSLTPEDAAVA